MKEKKEITRRSFLKAGGMATALGTIGLLGIPTKAPAWQGKFATLIDLSRCDGCEGEEIPKCVAACRSANAGKFPVPEKPIRNLWPRKFHDDWSDKTDVTDRLTPYNWTTVQNVTVEGKKIHIPRRCMHCDNPPCANLCPFGALSKYENGSVVINPGLCMGGAKCKSVCPWHIPQRQSGVGIYLKLHPVPAGGGVMYKCDLCHDRLEKGLQPACVEACTERLGPRRVLFFGSRAEITKRAHDRVREIDGFLYGEKENGGTSTFYISPVPFEKIHAQLQRQKTSPLMGRVKNALDDVNGWAKGFLFGPLLGLAGAVGLALFRRKGPGKESEK